MTASCTDACSRFSSAEELAEFLDGLHEMTPDGAITGRKWSVAQHARAAVLAAAEQDGPEYSRGADGSVLADFTSDPGYWVMPEQAAEIASVRDTLIVAADNPVSHGGLHGLQRIMRAQAERLRAVGQPGRDAP